MDHSLGTLTPATVAFILHESLRELTGRFPNVMGLLWRTTLIDAAIFREWMTGMGRRDAYGRIAHLLCELYFRLAAVGHASEHRCHLPLTQIELADALGLTSLHVNRMMKELRGRELIALTGSTLVIEAWDAMVRDAEFDATYLHLAKRLEE
ncbi:Crp/Fnr family transcriptional regulator [uncultured Methylobacterium sp.]|uniref:Crp/Fnr family transcriptional regulator n=1 Tax=uncultured Methylobacterium sp. TaxID=157278 RepID=UPI002594A067|nr:Crp/Fnr family transcriptional regulator [uncultured Methylobacterium sp.]